MISTEKWITDQGFGAVGMVLTYGGGEVTMQFHVGSRHYSVTLWRVK